MCKEPPSETVVTKCKFCNKSVIEDNAEVCPVCHSPQNLLKHYFPPGVVVGLVAAIPAFVGVALTLSETSKAEAAALKADNASRDAEAAVVKAKEAAAVAESIAESIAPLSFSYRISKKVNGIAPATEKYLDFDRALTEGGEELVSDSAGRPWKFVAPSDGLYIITGQIRTSVRKNLMHTLRVSVVAGNQSQVSTSEGFGSFVLPAELREGDSVFVSIDLRYTGNHAIVENVVDEAGITIVRMKKHL